MEGNATVRNFLRAFGSRWFTLMSGPLTVPLAAIAFVVPGVVLKVLFAALAVVSGIVASYGIWAKERRSLLDARTEALKIQEELKEEIERISKPDKCPVVRIHGWFPAPTNAFILQSEGETADEISLEEFEIEPSVVVASACVSTVVCHQLGSAQMPVWIKDTEVSDPKRYDLASAFHRAALGEILRKTLRITYRDHNDFWYRTTQPLTYIPSSTGSSGRFEFGAIKHEKLGLLNPNSIDKTATAR